ncbi:MAG TPA: OmpA family protein [Steroidobacter sp.]|uniref:OmpA family protein n=1 Tax=Steroidobacter sp. TaxID=1978227 RepID=UPI002EDA23E5
MRRRSAIALGISSAILLAACAANSTAAAQSEARDQKQKLEHRRDVNADARRDADRLRHEIDELQAEAIDRGLLLTLGDALFTTNDATLSRSGLYRLNALAGFLENYPERAVTIDGYAGAGGYRYDLALVKRRAEAVKAYLVQQGIAPSRFTVRGNRAALPDDGSAPAQQPLRRVEVIIENSSTSG